MDQTHPLGNSPPRRAVPRRDSAAEFREPATAVALWPTFMRRTLTEETVRRAPLPVVGDAPRDGHAP